MSKLSVYAKKVNPQNKAVELTRVQNYMGGTSYILNPLETLRIVAASSIFGERRYYEEGMQTNPHDYCHSTTAGLRLNTAEKFETTVDAALTFDFKATLELAVELRNVYYMRLNPAVIYILAALHPDRQAFNKENTGYMRQVCKQIALRPDDITNQFEYYMYFWGKKNNLPNIVKRAWSDVLGGLNYYQLAKYQSRLIDVIRISHANSKDIDTLMRNGKLEMTGKDTTWERLRSTGLSWLKIANQIKIPHMALLRNLRGIFSELDYNNSEHRLFAEDILKQLVAGVKTGKQFPFRYYSAYKAIEYTVSESWATLVKDALEECIDMSIENMPKLKGRTICLSDNSGSAWDTLPSKYGRQTVATIGNLSSILTVLNSDHGEVAYFGNNLKRVAISKRKGVLSQMPTMSDNYGLGQATENGIWLFFKEALERQEFFDNIFIYSDQQAGHGGLYGQDPDEYKEFTVDGRYIDVMKLVSEYRKKVNPKVNVFCIQTAGYDNTLLPENLYRGANLAGWTGKEILYASEIIKIWDEKENNQ